MRSGVRFVIAGMLFAALILMLHDSSLSRAFAAAGTPALTIDVQNAAPRRVEDSTQKAVERDYSAAWQAMTEALNHNRPELITANFVGAAADKLTATIRRQQQSGLHQRLVDKGHSVRVVFYSSEGSAMELQDTVNLQIQLLDGDKVINAEDTTFHYVALVSAAENSWKVRVLDAVPSY